MHIPEWFRDQLDREFGGRLRIRWSVLRRAFHIEERVARPRALPFRIDEADDRTLRVRDGYDLFCEVARGDRLPCPECGQEVKVAPLAFAEASCGRCRARNKEGRWTFGFFPLNDTLLQYLRSCDSTLTDQHGRVRAMDEENARREAIKEGDLTDERQAILKDGLIHEQIPKVGYTKDWAAYRPEVG